MFCSNCGKDLSDNATFCDECGSPVHSQDAQNAVPTTPEADLSTGGEETSMIQEMTKGESDVEGGIEPKTVAPEEDLNVSVDTPLRGIVQTVPCSTELSDTDVSESKAISEEEKGEQEQKTKKLHRLLKVLIGVAIAFVALVIISVLVSSRPLALESSVAVENIGASFPKSWTVEEGYHQFGSDKAKFIVPSDKPEDGFVYLDSFGSKDKLNKGIDSADEMLKGIGFDTSGDAEALVIDGNNAYKVPVTISISGTEMSGSAVLVDTDGDVGVCCAVSGSGADHNVSPTMQAVLDSLVTGSRCEVTFKSEDKTVATEAAYCFSWIGGSVEAPRDITRDGYVLDGWKVVGDSSAEVDGQDGATIVNNITDDITVEAEWVAAHTVTFTDGQGNVLSSSLVRDGDAATAPSTPTRDGYAFSRWDTDYSSVTSDMTITAIWRQKHTVTFTDGQGKTLSTKTVLDGDPAKAPTSPSRDGYTFEGWDTDFSAVTSDITVSPIWKALPTLSQKNAVATAKSYLSFTSFSYSGLIEQLEFDQYSHEDAVYGADNCGADWNEQAAKKAKEYLSFTSFSRNGLIDQLEFEGFTSEQAEYGVNAVGL